MENNLKNIHIYITESLCCTPETNIILEINYTSIKKEKRKEKLQKQCKIIQLKNDWHLNSPMTILLL